jgi:hypothetical protein
VILIVVLALLALFAVIGISFVFYADSEANAARIHREGQAHGEPAPPDAVIVINRALSTLIFDEDTDLNNPLRGHGLLRSVYGWNQTTRTQHTIPFNGVGTFHEGVALDLSAGLGLPAGTVVHTIPDRARWVNNSQMPYSGTLLNVDPEKTGYSGTPSGTARHYVGRNAAYTYPDLNNFYLASVSPSTGEILVKSFHRDWLFNGVYSPNITSATGTGGNPNVGLRLAPYDPTSTPGNTDWISPEGRTKILRPRPVDQLTPAEIVAAIGVVPGFPAGVIPYDIAYNTANPAYDGYRRGLAAMINAKIANGEIMGYPPPNADGLYSGDLQNVTGGVGTQRNDSILIDFGMPPIKFNGKYVQPLIALTILDHDGRVNLSVHGNVLNGAKLHESFIGIGPHEVNPRQVFDTTLTNANAASDIQALLNQRYLSSTLSPPGAQSRSGVGAMFFDRTGTQVPAYSLVTWNGTPNTYVSTSMPNFAVPPGTGTALQTSPIYTGAGWDNNLNTTSQANNHPGLFNPTQWPGPRDPNLPAGRVFDPLDFRRLNFRYAPAPDINSTQDVGQYAVNYLKGTFPAAPPPAQLTYRLDPAHPYRWMFTLRGSTLDFPGMMPNFLNASTNPLQIPLLPAGVPQPTLGQLTNASFTNLMPNPSGGTAPGTVTDFGSSGGTPPSYQWRHMRSALGPVDLNRPLADYRDLTAAVNIPIPQPLSPSNMGNALRAWADRHNLAKDIFGRLIVATGANATVDPATGDITINATVGTQQFDALRYLAQVAVNIVDYIDSDDISTPFLWCPSSQAGTGTFVLTTITDPVKLTYFPFTNIPDPTLPPPPITPLTSDFAAGGVGNHAVFGVEKPRLVLNEVYSEVTNNPNDPGPAPYTSSHVRFWVELLNPTSPPYTNAATSGPLGTGSAYLRYEPALDGLSTVPYAAYRLAVVQAGKTGIGSIDAQRYLNSGADPVSGTKNVGLDNVTGWVPPGTSPDIDYDFVDTNPTNNAARLTFAVAPNNGQYLADGNRAKGIVLVGPQIPQNGRGPSGRFPDGTAEFNPMNNLGMGAVPLPYTNMIVGTAPPGPTPTGANAMAYQTTLPTQTDLVGKPRNHIVMLRRLANPYLPPNDPAYPTYTPGLPPNPYVTVDFVNDVPAHDGVVLPSPDMTNDGKTARGPRDNPNTNNGYLPLKERFAVGKIQPYAAYAPPSAQPEAAGGSAYVPIWNTPPGNPYVPGQVFTTMGSTPNTLGAATFSCIVRQDPNPPAAALPAPLDQQPKHTFGRHNGRNDGVTFPPPSVNSLNPGGNPALLDTIAAPFDWFVHMDRPLANPLELRWVQAGKPHLVTQMFWQQSSRRGYGAAPARLPNYRPAKEDGLVPWFEPNLDDYANNTPGAGVTTYPQFAYNQTKNGLYRAFEMLRIKPFMYGVPVGGKAYGRVNLNTLQDLRVFSALLDPPPNMTSGGNGNMFDSYDVWNTNSYMWNRVIGSRTANMSTRNQPDGTSVTVPVPGPTYDDVGYIGTGPFAGYAGPLVPFPQADPRTGLDRPFRSYGGGEFGGAAAMFGGGGSAFYDSSATTPLSAFGPGVKDTIMRTFPEPQSYKDLPPFNNPNNVLQVPRLWVDRYSSNPAADTSNPGYLDRNHPYFRSEAARKLFNNVTTTSNTFTVMMTIVFHEVRTDPIQTWIVLTEPGTNRPLLGKEMYKEVPGDLRQQYFAIIDRTNATIAKQVVTTTDAAGNVSQNASYGVGPRPFFTTLEAAPIPADLTAMPPRNYTTIQVAAVQDAATSNVVSVIADGVPMPINVNDPLYIGVGSELEGVQVQGILSFANGIATLAVVPLSPITVPTPPPAGPSTPQLSKPHAVGTSISNVAVGVRDAANAPVSPPLPPGPPFPPNWSYTQYGYTIGNPGPRGAGGFQYWNQSFQPVLPFVIRIR